MKRGRGGEQCLQRPRWQLCEVCPLALVLGYLTWAEWRARGAHGVHMGVRCRVLPCGVRALCLGCTCCTAGVQRLCTTLKASSARLVGLNVERRSAARASGWCTNAFVRIAGVLALVLAEGVQVLLCFTCTPPKKHCAHVRRQPTTMLILDTRRAAPHLHLLLPALDGSAALGTEGAHAVGSASSMCRTLHACASLKPVPLHQLCS